MLKIIFALCLVVFNQSAYSNGSSLSSSYSLSEEDSLSRVRFFVGGVRSHQEDFKSELYPFLNFNYRTIGDYWLQEPVSVRWFMEGGVNFLAFFLPSAYAKLGPEIKLMNNFYLFSSLGLFFGYFFSPFIVPFGGTGFNYVYPISKSISLEMETGIHLPIIFVSELFLFPYITIGIAFN